MEIIVVSETNLCIYKNLAQCYEAEFSKITGKKPDTQGIFELDTQLSDTVRGLLLMIEGIPAGIAAIALKENSSYEMCEFYVVPSFRKNSAGMNFAHGVWKMYPGAWAIKQIEGAEYASEFWRKTISRYDQTLYVEEHCLDPYWGLVTCQRFHINL